MKLTCQGEQNQPVDDEDWPEDRDIEDRKEGASEPDNDGSGCRVPELELGKTSNEWAKLLILFGRKAASGAILHFIVYNLVAGVEFWLEEGEEEVQEVDTEGICDCDPILGVKYM